MLARKPVTPMILALFVLLPVRTPAAEVAQKAQSCFCFTSAQSNPPSCRAPSGLQGERRDIAVEIVACILDENGCDCTLILEGKEAEQLGIKSLWLRGCSQWKPKIPGRAIIPVGREQEHGPWHLLCNASPGF
jgi:hypothetical protein